MIKLIKSREVTRFFVKYIMYGCLDQEFICYVDAKSEEDASIEFFKSHDSSICDIISIKL